MAETAFKDAININAEHAGARYGLAITYLSQNRKAEGMEELEEVIRLEPDSSEAEQARNILKQLTNNRKENVNNE